MWDGKKAASYHGEFLIQDSQFHLTVESYLADVHISITTFWVLSYNSKKKRYVAWLFGPGVDDPTPIYFEGDWDSEAQCLTLHMVTDDSDRDVHYTFYPPSKEIPYP